MQISSTSPSLRLFRVTVIVSKATWRLRLITVAKSTRLYRPDHMRHVWRSRILGVVFAIALQSKLDYIHSLLLPYNHALEIIAKISKLKLDNAMNSGKCKVFQQLLSIVDIYLNGLRIIIDSILGDDIEPELHRIKRYEGLSGYYYALKHLCRVLWQGNYLMKNSTGDLLSSTVFTMFESLKTFECMVIDLDDCFNVLVTKFEEFVQKNYHTLINNNFHRDLKPLRFSGKYLSCLLQEQGKKDREQVISKLKQHTKSYWPDFMNSLKKKLSTGDESTLIQLMLQRLSDNLQACNEIELLNKGFYVDRKYVKIVRDLRTGSYGIVQEVNCFGQKYAMKTVRGTSNVEYVNEAVIHAKLQHPHIVKLVWYSNNVEMEDSLSLLMELMDMDLDTFMRQKTNGTKTSPWNCTLVALDIMLQIAKAMRYLHEQGIMHRDLKSANVLVDLNRSPNVLTDGYIHVCVADFGLAKLKEVGAEQLNHTAKVGTKYWRAPEVFGLEKAGTDQARYTVSADVYSFAMTGYEIITRKTPFADSNRNGLKERIVKLNERPELPTNLHPRLCDLISRCWDGCAEARPSFKVICGELEEIKKQLLFG